MTTHTVRCGDYAHYHDPDDEWRVRGFASAEHAAEYARRFVRARIEEFRAAATSPDALRQTYLRWGEYAATTSLDHRDWVEFCLVNPATAPEDTDYDAIEPRP